MTSSDVIAVTCTGVRPAVRDGRDFALIIAYCGQKETVRSLPNESADSYFKRLRESPPKKSQYPTPPILINVLDDSRNLIAEFVDIYELSTGTITFDLYVESPVKDLAWVTDKTLQLESLVNE